MRWASPISERLGTWRFSISKIVPEHRRRLIMSKLGRLCLPSHWNRIEFFKYMTQVFFLLSLLSMMIACIDGCLWAPYNIMETKNWICKWYIASWHLATSWSDLTTCEPDEFNAVSPSSQLCHILSSAADVFGMSICSLQEMVMRITISCKSDIYKSEND